MVAKMRASVNKGRNDFRKEIEESSKDIICSKGDIVPQFFVFDRNGSMSLVAMPLDLNDDDTREEIKEKSVKELKEVVERLGSEQYFAAMTGWGINNEKLKELIQKSLEEYQDGMMTLPELIEYASALKMNPTNNPAREEFLILSECRKDGKSASKLIRIKRYESGITFDDVDKWKAVPDGSFRWNIWARGQFDE
jgi:hypothetical protein